MLAQDFFLQTVRCNGLRYQKTPDDDDQILVTMFARRLNGKSLQVVARTKPPDQSHSCIVDNCSSSFILRYTTSLFHYFKSKYFFLHFIRHNISISKSFKKCLEYTLNSDNHELNTRVG